jgi:hypothetical protein
VRVTTDGAISYELDMRQLTGLAKPSTLQVQTTALP